MNRQHVPNHHLCFDLYALRKRLGGVVGRGGAEWRGPGPGHSRHDMSLSVTIASDGYVLVFSHAGDDFRACCEHIGLQHKSANVSNSAARRPVRMTGVRSAHDGRDRAEKVAFVHRVWAATVEASL